jgi:diguanylate cyclase (GGDEF)-like protein
MRGEVWASIKLRRLPVDAICDGDDPPKLRSERFSFGFRASEVHERTNVTVDRELARRSLEQAWRALIPPIFASFLLPKLIGSSPTSTIELVWVFASSFSALYAVVLCRQSLRLTVFTFKRLRLAVIPHVLIGLMAIVAFRPNATSPRNLVLVAFLLIMCIVLATTFAGDAVLGYAIIVLYSCAAPIGASTVASYGFGWRVLSGLAIAATIAPLVRILNQTLRANVQLSFAKDQLVDELRTANLSLNDVNLTLHEQLLVDSLTGVANRLGLTNALLDAAEKCSPIGVLYVDIDHFKQVNDSRGHAGGDQLLIELAATLAASIRPGDLVARLGGDEFVLLLMGATQPDVVALSSRFRARMRGQESLRGITVSVGGASGILGIDSSDEILGRADQRLYEGKRAGRDRAVVSS